MNAPPAPRRDRPSGLIRAYVRLLLALPMRWRVGLAGWLGGSAPMRRSGRARRIRQAIQATLPGTDPAAAARLTAEVLRNTARSQIELLSGAGFVRLAAAAPVEGPGLAALETAHRARRPVILLVSHFGNAAAMAAALDARGIEMASFFKPLPDPVLDRIYRDSLLACTRPLFPFGRAGVAMMLRHLKAGGKVTISFDLHRPEGATLDFLGRPAFTTLSPAEMALRFDALLVPVFGLRRDDGGGFRVHIAAPIPAGPPETMMQAANDALATMVRAHPAQWLWWHQRWRGAQVPADDGV